MFTQIFSSSIDISVDDAFVLTILIALEAVLSADNAIALASIAQGLENQQLQRRALNFGLLIAYVLRITLIFTATWVIQYWQVEVIGALYLLWLVFRYFTSAEDGDPENREPRFANLWQAIPIIAFTDLAFSLDSVTTAIAVSDEIWLIILGGTIGVIALRFLAGLFIRLLKEFTHLEDAGYITVGFVGIRLLLRAYNEQIVPPEWVMFIAIIAVFLWGFSERTLPESAVEE